METLSVHQIFSTWFTFTYYYVLPFGILVDLVMCHDNDICVCMSNVQFRFAVQAHCILSSVVLKCPPTFSSVVDLG